MDSKFNTSPLSVKAVECHPPAAISTYRSCNEGQIVKAYAICDLASEDYCVS